MKPESYWSYAYSMFGKKETFKESYPPSDEDFQEIISGKAIEPKGKYSSLAQAVKGFLNEEIGQESKINLRKEEDGSVAMDYETYVNSWYMPATYNTMKNWKNGEIESLVHVKGTVKFWKHESRAATFEEFEEIASDVKKSLENFKKV